MYGNVALSISTAVLVKEDDDGHDGDDDYNDDYDDEDIGHRYMYRTKKLFSSHMTPY